MGAKTHRNSPVPKNNRNGLERGSCKPGARAPEKVRKRAVEVRSCAVKNRAVSNRNCVAAMRGGEQRNENDRSVTQAVPEDPRELGSVGVSGRVCEQKTKPAKRVNPGQPGEPRSTHRWLETEWSAVPMTEIRETRRGQWSSWQGPEEPPGGSQSVRSSVEAGNDRGAKGRRKVDAQ